MSKQIGEPYDPVLRLTDEGQRIYNAWRKVRKHPHCEEWDYFPTFYDWSMQNGFTLDTYIHFIDDGRTLGPANCVWQDVGDKKIKKGSWVDNWNRSVNRIRKHYGMPPLEGTDYGD